MNRTNTYTSENRILSKIQCLFDCRLKSIVEMLASSGKRSDEKWQHFLGIHRRKQRFAHRTHRGKKTLVSLRPAIIKMASGFHNQKTTTPTKNCGLGEGISWSLMLRSYVVGISKIQRGYDLACWVFLEWNRCIY